MMVEDVIDVKFASVMGSYMVGDLRVYVNELAVET